MRCRCLTARGTQCKRNSTKNSQYCYQHQSCRRKLGRVTVTPDSAEHRRRPASAKRHGTSVTPTTPAQGAQAIDLPSKPMEYAEDELKLGDSEEVDLQILTMVEDWDLPNMKINKRFQKYFTSPATRERLYKDRVAFWYPKEYRDLEGRNRPPQPFQSWKDFYKSLRIKGIKNRPLSNAITRGDSESVSALLMAGAPFYRYALEDAMEYALESGQQKNILHILITAGVPIYLDALEYAMAHPNYYFIQSVVEKINIPPDQTKNWIMSAISNGYNNVIRWLLKKGIPMDNSMILTAVRADNTKALEMLIEAGAPIDRKAVPFALRGGNSEILEKLIQAGAPMDKLTAGRLNLT